MVLKKFDIVNEIKTRVLLGGNLGSRTSRKIIDSFNNMPDESTLLIDVTEANVIDYNFCSEAIGPLFKSLVDGRFAKKYIIIQVDPDQKINLLEGILWHIYKMKSTKDSEKRFADSDLAIKLLDSQTKELEFVGNLSELQKAILNIINKKKEINAYDIAGKMSLPVEDIINNYLLYLEQKYFIYKVKKGVDYFYCSFYNFIKEDAQC